MLADSNSVTGSWLANRTASKPHDRRSTGRVIRLEGVRHHNLHGVDVEFPLGVLCVVTGVSGSGKSSLIHETLFPAVCTETGSSHGIESTGQYTRITGCEHISGVVMVDQKPIGRTAHSNPVTYLKAFDDIRRIFAATGEAKLRNFTPSTFSFNSKAGGRCAKCEGNGAITIDMQFLADLSMECPECNGRRYRADVLEAKYRGLSISEVLQLTVDDAFTYFRGHPKLQKRLQVLRDVGLGYVPLGQPATTLSGGESQRLKLAAYLAGVTAIEKSDRRTSSTSALFLLDEPTNGLHGLDVATLLNCLDALVSIGHSLIVIEHHLEVIRHADVIIDLGPGAGDDGGRIVATGTPEQVAQVDESVTGQLLR
jgi:excinuclease ABC subunit A